jgi:chemotaxis protein histidine kinase CheA
MADFKKEYPDGVKFSFLIEKAVAEGEGEDRVIETRDASGTVVKSETLPKVMRIEGVASTANVDLSNEVMTPDCLKAMADQINRDPIPLRSEHRKGWDDILGTIDKAWVDERNQLHISAKLDEDRSTAVDLYKAVKYKGTQLGLSVAGLVKNAGTKFVESIGKSVKAFHEVFLKEVSVTQRPCNFDTWLVAKSASEEVDKTAAYVDFLKHYPNLDWAECISKSVPDEFWDKEQKENMEIEKKLDKLSETVELLAKSIAAHEELLKAKTEVKKEDASEETTEETAEETEEEKTKKAVKMGDESESATETDNTEETTEEVVEKPETKKAKKAEVKKEFPPKEEDKKEEEEETTEEEAEKAKPVKKAEEKKEEEEETEDETEKAVKLSVESVAEIAKSLEERLSARGFRIVGGKQTVEKSLVRKGIASSRAFMIKKSEDEEEDEVEKSVADKTVSFKDHYKKHVAAGA